jgi:ribonuclease D
MKVVRVTLPSLSDPTPMHDLKSLPVFERRAKTEPKPGAKKGKKEKKVRVKRFSLAQLCVEYLGDEAVLEKSFQVSHWLRRPLLEAQLRYAESDAFVLLDIFAAWEKRRSVE